jgi:Na+-transporting NADH:ubiquinone oxidoreductase subunit A
MAEDLIKIRRGLDLPITGEPRQVVEDAPAVTRVAVLGLDYIGMRPTMAVREGDAVKLGQLLFEDKKTPGVRYTSPGSGKVVQINRGAKRALQSVVVELFGDKEERFDQYSGIAPDQLTREQVREKLVESGLWTALRTRPYSKIAPPEQVPHSIFVTAMDTSPLAADPQVVAAGHEQDFASGLAIMAKLTDGEVFVCKARGASIPAANGSVSKAVEFAGPHPAGLPGTHIHFLDPVGPNKTVWHLNYQDLIAFGKLFNSGRLWVERVVALGGPPVRNPRLLRTRLGACVGELVAGELEEGENRIISGGVFAGVPAAVPMDYLGRYHLQVSVLAEGLEREFLGWQKPGADKFSIKNIFTSKLSPGKKFQFTTSTEGSPRAMVPIGSYEQVMPLDIIPTFLLRSLIIGDTERAQALGCLELDEEDLGLCSFVCPGKYEYAPLLRRTLERIEKEG